MTYLYSDYIASYTIKIYVPGVHPFPDVFMRLFFLAPITSPRTEHFSSAGAHFHTFYEPTASQLQLFKVLPIPQLSSLLF